MTQNTKAGLQVIALTCSALLVALVFVAISHANSQKRAMNLSIQYSLKSCWKNVSEGKLLLGGSDIRNIFLYETNGMRYLPSFVLQEDIFCSSNVVSIQSQDLLCVVRNGKDLHGLCGNGECIMVSNDEFENWPKVAFK